MKKDDLCRIFGGNYNLEKRKIVESLEIGAKLYGGATKIDNLIFSNYQEGIDFDIKPENNTVGVIIPGTMDVDNPIDNSKFVEEITNLLTKLGKKVENTRIQGAWISEKGECIVENNNLLSFSSDLCTEDVELLQKIAQYVKKAMNQEGVSIIINQSLSIC